MRGAVAYRLGLIGALCSLVLYAAGAQADDIFLCQETKSGQQFWSGFSCDKHGGTVIDVLHVPELNFREQIILAAGARDQPGHKTRLSVSDPYVRTPECESVDRQLVEIWLPYKDEQYMPVNQFGADRVKAFELRDRRAHLGC